MSQQEQIAQYVMGDLSESEQLQTEEQYFTDANFLREVQAVCDDLMDAYLSGEMSAADRVRFEQRLREIPYLREQLKMHRALLHLANARAELASDTAPQWWAALAAWWARPLLPRFVTVAMVGVLGLSVIWFLMTVRQTTHKTNDAGAKVSASPSVAPSLQPFFTPAPTEGRAKNSASAKSSPPARVLPVIASIVLSADVTRGEEQRARLVIPSTNGIIRVQLELPTAQPHKYQAALHTAAGRGLQIWRNLSPTHHQAFSVLELSIPAHSLTDGEYVIELTGKNERYKFRFLVVPQ
jgi:anti-sigma factor RsiW